MFIDLRMSERLAKEFHSKEEKWRSEHPKESKILDKLNDDFRKGKVNPLEYGEQYKKITNNEVCVNVQ